MDYYTYQKAWKTLNKIKSTIPDPLKAAQTEIRHSQARLSAAGRPVPALPAHPTFLSQALDIISRPVEAVKAAVRAVGTPEKESILGEAWKGLTGQVKTPGEDVLRAFGIAPQSPKVRGALGFLTDVVLDPTTYLTFGATGLAKTLAQRGVKVVAPRVVKEIAAETGKTISRESAERLAQNAIRAAYKEDALKEAARLVGRTSPFDTPAQAVTALKTGISAGKIPQSASRLLPHLESTAAFPVGRIGTAVRRAMGWEAEIRPRPAGVREIERTIARQQAESLLHRSGLTTRSLLRRLDKAAEKGKVPKDVADTLSAKLTAPEKTIRGTLVGKGLPKYEVGFGSLMGFTKPLVTADITKIVNGLRATAARVGGERGEALFDRLGRWFVLDYTPAAYTGAGGTALRRAKEIITQHEREAPAAARTEIEKVLRQWKAEGIPEETRKVAPYIIEEPMTKEYKALTKASMKLKQVKEELRLLKEANADKRKLAGKARSVATWERKVKEADAALRQRRMENIGRETYTKAEEKTAKITRDMFAEDVERLYNAGISFNTLMHYVFHLYTDPPDIVRDALHRMAASRKIPASRPIFMLKRMIKSLKTAKDLGLHPVEDAAVLTAVHRGMAEQAIVLNQMGRELLKLGPEVVRTSRTAIPGWQQITDTAIPLLKDVWVHPEVGETLKRLYRVIDRPDIAVQDFNKLYNTAIRAMKGVLTSWNPRYHIVNFIGNIFLNTVDGVLDPKIYDEAAKILAGKLDYVIINGRKIPAKQVLEWFNRQGLSGQGMFRQLERAETLRDTAIARAGELGVASRVPRTLEDRMFAKPRQLGSLTDSYARMANFLHHLKQGMSPLEAASRTRTVLYDYGALTALEHKINRLLVPFYAWVRFNTPAMLKLMAMRPGIYTSIQHGIEAGKTAYGMKEEDIPEWVRDMMAVPIGVDEQGRYKFFNPALPLSDLSRIRPITDFGEMTREIASMINPMITLPIQAAVNRSAFLETEITKYPDLPMERLKDTLKFFAMQFGPTREVVAAYRYAQPETTPWATRRIPGLGSLQVTVNPEGVQRQKTFEYRDYLRQVINSLREKGVVIPEYKSIREAQKVQKSYYTQR